MELRRGLQSWALIRVATESVVRVDRHKCLYCVEKQFAECTAGARSHGQGERQKGMGKSYGSRQGFDKPKHR